MTCIPSPTQSISNPESTVMSSVESTPFSISNITEPTDSLSSSSGPLQTDESQQENSETTAMRDVILSFLRRCNIPYPLVVYDHDFDALCRADVRRRGLALDGPIPIGPFIPSGVVMSTTTYAHLTNTSTKIFIALYTAFIIYFEDTFLHHTTAVREFNDRFINGRPQAGAVHECVANLLREAPNHFGGVAANMLITSTLNFVTGIIIEHDTHGMTLSPSADRYPTFSRTMAGASEAYAVFVFPPEVPLPTYIQTIPNLMVYLNNGNDILSFYKEQIAGETLNHVSVLAGVKGTSKIEALSQIANETADAHEKTLQILAPYPEAYEVYVKFSHGYVGFHAGTTRYRLDELDL